MLRSSGNCTMYLVRLQGQATSCSPGASGAPTECSALTQGAPLLISSSARLPIRVMIRIEATTYSESVISTPSFGSGAS